MKPRVEVHPLSCAQQLRLGLVIAAGDPSVLPIEFLHEIANRIHGCCGHVPLKCHRLARGWSVTKAIDEFHEMCDMDPQRKRRGLTERSWRQWESGDNCDRDYQDLLCRLFSTGPVQLGFAKDYGPRRSDGPVTERSALDSRRLIDTVANEASEQAERAEISNVGPGALERLRFDVTRLSRDYVGSSPLPLLAEMRKVHTRISRLLDGRAHPGQAAELHFLAGATCGLMANASLDLGHHRAAEQLAQAAWTHGHVAGHHRVMAWSRDCKRSVRSGPATSPGQPRWRLTDFCTLPPAPERYG
jgi:hypothetical protein